MRGDARVAFALSVAVVVVAPARAADVAPSEHAARDVASLTARKAVLGEQADVARAGARWRARALYRVVVAGDALSPDLRARAIDAGARALARDLAEARALRAERDQLGGEVVALESAANGDEAIGAPPAFVMPVPGAVLVRFGVAPDRLTGVLLGHAGVRLAAAVRAAVRAPAAGVVARVAVEPEGATVVLDHGGGWTTVVGGLAAADVAQGDHLVAGQRLGAAAGAVGLEIWRGRHAVDPMLLMATTTPRPATATLAAPAPLP
ncbi:MAG TPA: peptidoglycan DD-metalloendopeptidase family protein [Polyangia bacterium]|jgi:murein DD-endopeptidase MepM/ murein hydrolase activator NlpD|nr:peptidoglycan DD-metalloendopeptidase family protein [Polyangia bacterium]